MTRQLSTGTLVLGLVLLLAPGHAAADSDTHPTKTSCEKAELCKNIQCLRDTGRCLLQQNDPAAAKTMLKTARARYPGDVPLTLLLVRAYLALDNRVWARRMLNSVAATHPHDCEVRSWQIWFHIRQAELDQADALLGEAGCPGGGPGSEPLRVRWILLKANVSRLRQQPEATLAEVSRAYDQPTMYAEDRPLLKSLTHKAMPRRSSPVQLRLELGTGYTSDGLGSSPANVPTGGAGFGSPVLFYDGLILFEAPLHRVVRPMAELSVRGLWLLSNKSIGQYDAPGGGKEQERLDGFSSISLRLRAGLALGPVRLLYSGTAMALHGGDEYDDGPRMEYETHRGELEWDASSSVTVLLGVGRSLFRQRVRSRTEFDGGVSMTGTLWRLRLLGAVTARAHLAGKGSGKLGAIIEPYTAVGSTLIGSATLPVGDLFHLRARLLALLDVFPRSKGTVYDRTGLQEASEDRRDLLLKGGLYAWSNSFNGLRFGLSYEITHRFALSDVDFFEYTDHRVLLRARFNIRLDPWAPDDSKTGAGHVRLPHGGGGGDQLEEERIQDILRQEDAVRRGSSCVN